MELNKIEKHSVLSNIFFYFKIWIKVYPQYVLLLVLSIPSGVISTYSELLIPKLIINGIENNLTMQSILKPLLIISLLMIMTNCISNFISFKLMAKGTMAKSYLNSDMILNKLFNLNYEKVVDSEIQNKIAKVKEIISEGDSGTMHQFGNNLVVFFTSIFGIIFFAFNIIKIDIVLLIIIILTAIINSLYGLWANKYQFKNISIKSIDSKKTNYILNVSKKRDFFKDIKIYKMENWLTENFNIYKNNWANFVLKSENVRLGSLSINALMIFIRDIFSYIYLINKLLTNEISISYFVFMLGLVIAFSNWINNLISKINDLISFSININHIRDFLDLKEDNFFIGVSPKIENDAPSIEFKDISYKYPGSSDFIFKSFNLKIPAKEKLAIVGLNGSGKTTLMLLLMGLLEPTEGNILIDGYDCRKFNKLDYYKLFSPVFQDITIFPESIISNISGSLKYDKCKIEKAIYDSGMNEFISSLPEKDNTFLLKTSKKNAIDLSGGQNQKLLLARSLYKNGKINILDEPTAALDPIAESYLYEKYNSMSKNKTSIFISHRLASTKFCDRIILMEHGQILEEGTHDELLLKNSKYKEMFEIQSQYYKDGGVHLEM